MKRIKRIAGIMASVLLLNQITPVYAEFNLHDKSENCIKTATNSYAYHEDIDIASVTDAGQDPDSGYDIDIFPMGGGRTDQEDTSTPSNPTTITDEIIIPDNLTSEIEFCDTIFHYETDIVSADISMNGIAKLEKQNASQSDADHKNSSVRMRAVPVSEIDERYQLAINAAGVEEENVQNFSGIKFEFYDNDELLDVSECSMTAEITPGENVIRKANDLHKERSINPEADAGIEFSVISDKGNGYEKEESLMLYADESKENTIVTSINSEDPILFLSVKQANNPKFTVQYYSTFVKPKRDPNGVLKIINTDNGGQNKGGNLPKNGNLNLPIISLAFKDAGNGKKSIDTETITQALYRDKEFTYFEAPSLTYMGYYYFGENHQIDSVWILKDGKSANSTNKDDFEIYENITEPDKLHFTNDPDKVNKNTILIEDGDVIRLCANSLSGTYENDVTFYDYDITDEEGYGSRATLNPNKENILQGINNEANYSGNGAKFAFGNGNTGLGIENIKWGNNRINAYNRIGSYGSADYSYMGCAFEMVTGLDENNNIIYADGIDAPKLFNEGNAIGKTPVGGWSLKFNRNGDMYTLSGVPDAGLSDLEYFNNPSNGSTTYTNIWTNNFWPMDDIKNNDPLTGGAYKSFKQQSISYKTVDGKREYYIRDGYNSWPSSDDGIDHNNMFGMHFEVNFNLTEDYIGPLDYYFFGDDDMWVFLDGELVCDIGGVHKSVGSYVNLWDYLDSGDTGNHTLSFFYTERGLSGSVCYMQFLLPSVNAETTTWPPVPDSEYGSLRIDKDVINGSDANEEYVFDLTITDSENNPLFDDYPIDRYSFDGTKISSDLIMNGKITFKLKDGEYIKIKQLPVGYKWSVTETNIPKNCQVSYTTDKKTESVSEKTAEGIISENHASTVTFTNTISFVLPETGGSGIIFYFCFGILMMTASAYILSDNKRKK